MCSWHSHQRWFERLHGEKPTNLMSHFMTGWELARLYDPTRVHVKKLTTHLSEFMRLWPESNSDSGCVSYINSTRAQRDFCQSVYHSPQTTACWVKFGTSWVNWDNSDSVTQWRMQEWLWYRTGRGWNQVRNKNTKPHSSTSVTRSTVELWKHNGNYRISMYNMSAVCRKQMHSFDYLKKIYLYAHTLLYSG